MPTMLLLLLLPPPPPPLLLLLLLLPLLPLQLHHLHVSNRRPSGCCSTTSDLRPCVGAASSTSVSPCSPSARWTCTCC
jgi:hypothetical protein